MRSRKLQVSTTQRERNGITLAYLLVAPLFDPSPDAGLSRSLRLACSALVDLVAAASTALDAPPASGQVVNDLIIAGRSLSAEG